MFKGKKRLEEVPSHTLHYGELIDKEGNTIDEVLISVFRAPHSYTGEDSTEISCHGSSYIVRQILHALINAGCRQAEPGEFTQRAYLNGKMDLSQAEAVAELIASTNQATHAMALGQLKGHFSSRLAILRDQLLHITSLLELELDFSDHEELEFADRSELLALAQEIEAHITALTHSFEVGKAIRNGVPVAIVGKTNVGKSTLLNKLLHEEKAIVSDIQGTTRDSIEDTIDLHGVTFRFIDTAGIRETHDTIERIGITRTWQKVAEATIVLWMLDTKPEKQEILEMIKALQEKKLIVVQNKIDRTENASISLTELTNQLSEAGIQHRTAMISAKDGTGISELEQLIYEAADIPELHENDVVVTNARHYSALMAAHESITRVVDALQNSIPGDLVAEDLRICLDQLGDITGGKITPSEVLINIFKHFCIGK